MLLLPMLLTFLFMQNSIKMSSESGILKQKGKQHRTGLGGTRISYPLGNTSIPNELG